MISCVIVEDEYLAREKLHLYVNEHEDLNLVASYASAEDFLKQSKNLNYELLLLDIGLPNIDGITLATRLPINCQVIFTTAFAEYAVEAFNLNAKDYLLKPFNFGRFSRAIEKVKSFNSRPIKSIPVDNNILLKEGKKMHRLDTADILYVQGLKEYVIWKTINGKLVTMHSLSHLSDYLKPFDFIQTHKSYIVNALKVSVIEYAFVYLGKEKIPIGRSYRANVKDRFRAGLE